MCRDEAGESGAMRPTHGQRLPQSQLESYGLHMGLARGDASQAADRRAIDPEQFGDLRPVQPLSNHLDHGTTCAGHASAPTVEGLAHRTDRRGSRCNNALQRAIGRLELGEPEQLEQVAPRQAGQNSCHAIACVSPGHPQTKQVRQVGSLGALSYNGLKRSDLLC